MYFFGAINGIILGINIQEAFAWDPPRQCDLDVTVSCDACPNLEGVQDYENECKTTTPADTTEVEDNPDEEQENGSELGENDGDTAKDPVGTSTSGSVSTVYIFRDLGCTPNNPGIWWNAPYWNGVIMQHWRNKVFGHNVEVPKLPWQEWPELFPECVKASDQGYWMPNGVEFVQRDNGQYSK